MNSAPWSGSSVRTCQRRLIPSQPSPTSSGWSKAHGRPGLRYSFTPRDRHGHYRQRSSSTPTAWYKRD